MGLEFEDLGFWPGPDMSRLFTSESLGVGPLSFPLCKMGHDPCHSCPLMAGSGETHVHTAVQTIY